MGVTVGAYEQCCRKGLGEHPEHRVTPFATERFGEARLREILRLIECHGHSAGCGVHSTVFRNGNVPYGAFNANPKRSTGTSNDRIAAYVFLHGPEHWPDGRWTRASNDGFREHSNIVIVTERRVCVAGGERLFPRSGHTGDHSSRRDQQCDGMTVEAIKEAIAQLPEDERHGLAAWLNKFHYDDWDRQMVADFSLGGRGMALVESVKREITQARAVPFDLGLEQAETERNR